MKLVELKNLIYCQNHITWSLDLKKEAFFCYFKSLFRLLKKEQVNVPYSKTLFSMFTALEKQVYEFYNKKYPQKGPLIKWIEKNWLKNQIL